MLTSARWNDRKALDDLACDNGYVTLPLVSVQERVRLRVGEWVRCELRDEPTMVMVVGGPYIRPGAHPVLVHYMVGNPHPHPKTGKIRVSVVPRGWLTDTATTLFLRKFGKETPQ